MLEPAGGALTVLVGDPHVQIRHAPSIGSARSEREPSSGGGPQIEGFRLPDRTGAEDHLHSLHTYVVPNPFP
ncbi:hypothetical protein GCM10009734_19170 [Nonomuraea bangladeshensis]